MASYTKQIPAGGEGKITIMVKTKGYGDKTIDKKITVFTNDKNNPKLFLRIVCKVEAFATLMPEYISIKGPPDESVSKTLTIVPRKKYPFKITGTGVKNGKNIRFGLEEKIEYGRTVYQLTVTNLMEKEGRYRDNIYLKTDSNVRPEIPIAVHAIISQPTKLRENSQE